MIIKYYDDSYLESLNELLKEVFSVSKEYKSNNSDYFELVAIKEDRVIGYLNLTKCINVITGENYFYVNYVCVSKESRGCGVALALFDRVFELSKKIGISYLELTSNPKRVEAHRLYKKIGFEERETTVFRKEIV